MIDRRTERGAKANKCRGSRVEPAVIAPTDWNDETPKYSTQAGGLVGAVGESGYAGIFEPWNDLSALNTFNETGGVLSFLESPGTTTG